MLLTVTAGRGNPSGCCGCFRESTVYEKDRIRRILVIGCREREGQNLFFLQNLINGVSIGAVYAIIALGDTMVYGIAKMLNFAHGDVIMVGAYISFSVTTYMGLPAIVGIAAAILVCTILGILIEGLAYKPLRGAPSLAVLITAIGVSYFLQNAAQLIWGSAPKNFTSIITFEPFTLFNGQLTITGGTTSWTTSRNRANWNASAASSTSASISTTLTKTAST